MSSTALGMMMLGKIESLLSQYFQSHMTPCRFGTNATHFVSCGVAPSGPTFLGLLFHYDVEYCSYHYASPAAASDDPVPPLCPDSLPGATEYPVYRETVISPVLSYHMSQNGP